MATPPVDPAGIALIKEFEGCHLTAYYCPAGVLTIGWGSTLGLDDQPVRAGSSVSQAQADQLFDRDINRFASKVDRLVQVPINPFQRAALVSFAYNVGTGALSQSTLLRRLNAGDYAGAAQQFDRWTRGGGRVLPGLVRRRTAEKKLFLRAADSAAVAEANTISPARRVALTRPVLQKKSTGPDVALVQYSLNKFGYRLDQDGIFGELVHGAVVDFQRRRGLTVDGVVGPETWEALG